MEELLPFNEPEYIANPYAYWERLRDEAPVYWSETNGFWVISRYDDVLKVLHDPVLCQKSADQKRQQFPNTGGRHDRRSRPCVPGVLAGIRVRWRKFPVPERRELAG